MQRDAERDHALILQVFIGIGPNMVRNGWGRRSPRGNSGDQDSQSPTLRVRHGEEWTETQESRVAQAVSLMQSLTRRRRLTRIHNYHPQVFRSNNPQKMHMPPRMADYGTTTFAGREMPLPSSFIRLADSRQPYMSDEQYADAAARMMSCHWAVSSPGGLISIAASSMHDDDNLEVLPTRLLHALHDGIAKAAIAMEVKKEELCLGLANHCSFRDARSPGVPHFGGASIYLSNDHTAHYSLLTTHYHQLTTRAPERIIFILTGRRLSSPEAIRVERVGWSAELSQSTTRSMRARP